MSSLRNKIIRLAHSKPELRSHLLPLLKVSMVRRTYRDYLELHKVHKTKGNPLSKKAWEQFGGGSRFHRQAHGLIGSSCIKG